ncbi:MAG: penicillin acylase family protein, partial [Bryobacteraceae bacterium]
MAFRKLLAALNSLIVVAAAILVGAVWWYAWRPLPEKSGTVRADVSRPVRIARDALGVPHIQAETLDDALYAQGYATAQERLWQMEALRRLAAGELSEVVGPGALELDREARTLRMRRLAEEAVPLMPAADRAALAAYARGVNAFIETHRDRLPLEFRLLGFEPRPWRVTDSALAGFQMIRTLTTTWKDEMLKRNLLNGGDRAKVDFLFPVRGGGEIMPGSNAWAISGQWTASGKAILANDMHLEWSIPGTWFMAHLTAPGLNVKGVTLPGLPGVIVGHNERIAWGITNLHFDVQDLYREQGEARTEPEVILVKGAKPVESVVWVT